MCARSRCSLWTILSKQPLQISYQIDRTWPVSLSTTQMLMCSLQLVVVVAPILVLSYDLFSV